MTDDRPTGGLTPAEAELADAMDSIQSTGEDWRSNEPTRSTGGDRGSEEGSTDSGQDRQNGVSDDV